MLNTEATPSNSPLVKGDYLELDMSEVCQVMMSQILIFIWITLVGSIIYWRNSGGVTGSLSILAYSCQIALTIYKL